MIEKIDFKTDLEVGADTQSIGVDPITGLQMYRRQIGLESNLLEKKHTIPYEEWLIAKDGKLYEEFYRIKRYILVDIVSPPYPAFTTWMNQLSPAIMPPVNQTLTAMPIGVEDNHVTTA